MINMSTLEKNQSDVCHHTATVWFREIGNKFHIKVPYLSDNNESITKEHISQISKSMKNAFNTSMSFMNENHDASDVQLMNIYEMEMIKQGYPIIRDLSSFHEI